MKDCGAVLDSWEKTLRSHFLSPAEHGCCVPCAFENRFGINNRFKLNLSAIESQNWEKESCSGEVDDKARTLRIDAECALARDWLAEVWVALFCY